MILIAIAIAIAMGGGLAYSWVPVSIVTPPGDPLQLIGDGPNVFQCKCLICAVGIWTRTCRIEVRQLGRWVWVS